MSQEVTYAAIKAQVDKFNSAMSENGAPRVLVGIETWQTQEFTPLRLTEHISVIGYDHRGYRWCVYSQCSSLETLQERLKSTARLNRPAV